MRKLKITSTDIPPMTLTTEQAKARYNIGTNTLNKVAEDAGAVIYIGRRKIFFVEKMDEYMRQLAES